MHRSIMIIVGGGWRYLGRRHTGYWRMIGYRVYECLLLCRFFPGCRRHCTTRNGRWSIGYRIVMDSWMMIRISIAFVV